MHELDKWCGRWIEMIYEDRQGKLSQRIVYVQRVTGRYMVAYCSKRQATRRFVTARILSAAPLVSHAG